VFLALSPYRQDPNDHRFADQRAFLGIPNGHTLKHLAAGASTAAIWLWLVKRQPIAAATASLP